MMPYVELAAVNPNPVTEELFRNWMKTQIVSNPHTQEVVQQSYEEAWATYSQLFFEAGAPSGRGLDAELMDAMRSAFDAGFAAGNERRRSVNE
jgi:hypothetical protein